MSFYNTNNKPTSVKHAVVLTTWDAEIGECFEPRCFRVVWTTQKGLVPLPQKR